MDPEERYNCTYTEKCLYRWHIYGNASAVTAPDSGFIPTSRVFKEWQKGTVPVISFEKHHCFRGVIKTEAT